MKMPHWTRKRRSPSTSAYGQPCRLTQYVTQQGYSELGKCQWPSRAREASERRGGPARVEALPDGGRALLWAELRGVDLEVVQAGFVDRVLPPPDRLHLGRHAGGPAALDDGVQRTADADHERGQPVQSPGAVEEDGAVVVADVDHHVQPQPAVRGDGFVEGGVERREERYGRIVRLARAQSNARLEVWRGRLPRHIHAEVDPGAVERLLHLARDRRLPRPRRAVQDDDLAKLSNT